MWVVTAQAICRTERLVLVRLLQVRVFRIVTIRAQRRRSLRQVESVFRGGFGPRLMRRMAGVAAHVERSMAAALGRDIHPLLMAAEAEVGFFISRRRL